MSANQNPQSLKGILGKWEVHATVDDDGHLTLSIANSDGSEVLEVDTDLGEEDKWMRRFTTVQVEADYLQSAEGAVIGLQQALMDADKTPSLKLFECRVGVFDHDAPTISLDEAFPLIDDVKVYVAADGADVAMEKAQMAAEKCSQWGPEGGVVYAARDMPSQVDAEAIRWQQVVRIARGFTEGEVRYLYLQPADEHVDLECWKKSEQAPSDEQHQDLCIHLLPTLYRESMKIEVVANMNCDTHGDECPFKPSEELKEEILGFVTHQVAQLQGLFAQQGIRFSLDDNFLTWE